MKKKLSNTETEYLNENPDTINDKDILNSILLIEKWAGNSYSVALTEMSNKYLYKELENIFLETSKAARDAFEFAFNKGWYSLEESTDSKVSEAYKKFNTMKSE